jgi:hypothetical protein
VHEQQEDMKLTGTHQLPFCAHSINLPGKNVSTTQKNTGALLVTRKQAGLAVTAERTKYSYMLTSYQQNVEAKPNHTDAEDIF